MLPWLLPDFSAPCDGRIPQKRCLHVVQSHSGLSQVALSTLAALALCCSLHLSSSFLPQGCCPCCSFCLHSPLHTLLHGLGPHFIEACLCLMLSAQKGFLCCSYLQGHPTPATTPLPSSIALTMPYTLLHSCVFAWLLPPLAQNGSSRGLLSFTIISPAPRILCNT